MSDFTTKPVLTINTGNVLEIFGAAMATTAVYLLAGLPWALVSGAVFLLIGAEFVYVQATRIALPGLPRPKNPHLIQRFRLNRKVKAIRREYAAEATLQQESYIQTGGSVG